MERLPRTRALIGLGILFIQEFADYSVEEDRHQHSAVSWLDSLTRQIHKALPEDIDFFFAEIAKTILNGLVIQAPTQVFRITELEFYYNGRNHPDHYTHGAKEQLKHLHWYFNKAACLDLTFGDEETNSYGGILVRGLCALRPEPTLDQPKNYPYFIGPRIATRALVASWGSALAGATTLQLRTNPEPFISSVWATTRVGLKSNEKDEEAQPYLNRPYRFLADEDYLKCLPGKEKLCQQLGLDKETTLRILGYKPTWL